MISRVQYLRALEIVDLYHRQKSKNKDFSEGVERIAGKSKTDLSEVKVGDFLVYKRIVSPDLKDFTRGQKYEVIDKREKREYERSDMLKLKNQFGGETWIGTKNHYRRWETL